MNLSILSCESRDILKKVCQLKIRSSQAWEQTFGVFKGTMSEEEYGPIVEDADSFEIEAALKLSKLGEWLVYTHLISGSSGTGISNHDIEDKLIEKFGKEELMCDSEHSWFYVMTTADIVNDVYNLAHELTGAAEGLMWETYGGDKGVAEISIDDDPERYMIDGILPLRKTIQLLKDLINVDH